MCRSIVLILVATAAGLVAYRGTAAALRDMVGPISGRRRRGGGRRAHSRARVRQEPARRRGAHGARADARARGHGGCRDSRGPSGARGPSERRACRGRLGRGAMGPEPRHRDDASRPRGDHEPRIDPGRARDRRRHRCDRVGARPQPVHPGVPARRHAGRLARHEPREERGRSRPAGDRPGRGHARAVVPERPFVDRRRVLRRAGAARRTAPRATVRRPPSPGSRSASLSRWPAAACCSTCTGCPTSSPACCSAGAGLRCAPPPSAGGCSGSARRSRSAAAQPGSARGPSARTRAWSDRRAAEGSPSSER